MGSYQRYQAISHQPRYHFKILKKYLHYLRLPGDQLWWLIGGPFERAKSVQDRAERR